MTLYTLLPSLSGCAVAALLACSTPVAAADAPATGTAGRAMTFPWITTAGGVFRIKGDPGVTPGMPKRLVLDVTEAGGKSGVHRGLEKAARAANLYALAGIPRDAVIIAVVLHGKATPVSLSDDAYRRKYGTANPNTALLRTLNTAGISVRQCGQALRHAGFAEADVAETVSVDLSAVTTLVDLQSEGYALIP